MSQHDTLTQAPADEVERIIRSAVAAMPNTNPLVADDLIAGHTMHTEAEDIVAIWRAALSATQPAQAAQGEPADALSYASRLATHMWERYWKDDAPDWKPFPHLLGVLTQIDNMTSGMERKQAVQGAGDCGLMPLIDDYAKAVHDGDDAACQVLRRTIVASLEDGAQAAADARDDTKSQSHGALLQWAVDRWKDEVQNRPLINKNRRSLDDAWRQVVVFAGGDPDKLLGPSHAALAAHQQRQDGGEGK